MSSVKVLHVLNSKLAQLQGEVNGLKTSIKGVDVLAANSSTTDSAPVQSIEKADVVSIAERVASSAVASVKADCATVSKVEAGVTVRSMIPSIKAECVSVAKAIVGSGEELKKLKQDVEDNSALKDQVSAMQKQIDALVEKVDKLSLPKKAPARKVASKADDKGDDKIVI